MTPGRCNPPGPKNRTQNASGLHGPDSSHRSGHSFQRSIRLTRPKASTRIGHTTVLAVPPTLVPLPLRLPINRRPQSPLRPTATDHSGQGTSLLRPCQAVQGSVNLPLNVATNKHLPKLRQVPSLANDLETSPTAPGNLSAIASKSPSQLLSPSQRLTPSPDRGFCRPE